MNTTVSCIIPVYNEEKRVLPVIAAAKDCTRINEIIVVNDGSTDNTQRVLKHIEGIQLLTLSQNEGKSAALWNGLQKATGDIILLLDSDLMNLQASHIDTLLLPVLKHPTLVTIGLRQNSLFLYRLFGIDFVGGERALARTHLENLGNFSLLRYGIEIELNKYLLSHHVPILSVFLPGVVHPMKHQKQGFIQGTWGEVKMISNLASHMSLIALIKQLIAMARIAHQTAVSWRTSS